jgi:DNA-binding transcriptional ArsR family regulator
MRLAAGPVTTRATIAASTSTRLRTRRSIPIWSGVRCSLTRRGGLALAKERLRPTLPRHHSPTAVTRTGFLHTHALGMSPTGMKEHIRLLEETQLVTKEKVGRSRRCMLVLYAFEGISTWLQRLDRFAQVVERTKGAR